MDRIVSHIKYSQCDSEDADKIEMERCAEGEGGGGGGWMKRTRK